MKYTPIIFTIVNVRAILQSRKTQTRRIIRPEWSRCLDLEEPEDIQKAIGQSPYGKPGDRLWVRETWGEVCPEMMSDSDWYHLHNTRPMMLSPLSNIEDGVSGAIYRADGEYQFNKDYSPKGWRSPRYMPRWASRISLEVQNIGVSRLQDITDRDAIAEGISISTDGFPITTPRTWYHVLWDEINARYGNTWDSNPWVWVITFKKLEVFE